MKDEWLASYSKQNFWQKLGRKSKFGNKKFGRNK